MSFDYDKALAKNNEHGSWWTSYADLFMMLSIVFLLMYVAASLKQGTAGHQLQIEYKKLARRTEDLEQQIRVYNTLKDEALRQNTTEEEQEAYQQLMDKLDLLQDQNKNEKLALQQKAREHAQKEFALNRYQQLIRNIINANILAKSQIKSRDIAINVRDLNIEGKKMKIAEMEQTVARNEAQIADINTQLEDRITALRTEQARSKSSKAAMEKRIDQLRRESEAKVATLEVKNLTIAQKLDEVKGALADTKDTLAETESKLGQTESQLGQATQTIAQKEEEKSQLVGELQGQRQRYMQELAGLKKQHEDQMAAEKAAFEEGLRRERGTAAAKAKKLAKFMADAKAKEAELAAGLAGLQGKIADTEGKLRGAEEALAGTQARLAGTQQALAGTQAKLAGTQQALAGTSQKLAGTQQALAGTEAKLAGTQQALAGTQQALAGAEAEKGRALAMAEGLKGDLERTRAIANARKKLAGQIADSFAKSGLKGAVDGKTGEVTLDFGEEYFDTGSTALKPKMRMTLDKFIPIYARSIFNDPKIADKIANVEIIGFASSTFKGKYVNPQSIRQEDKEAIDFNLKLSFGRANSIFKHMLNHGTLSETEREKLLPLMKVVGRGYLPEGSNAKNIPTDITEKEFCKRYNCQKAQRVIVKFNMKD